MSAANPRVVYCSITGFGADAGADRPGYDFLVQAVSGLMSVTGFDEPTKAGVPLVDVLTGKDATIGILAALTARERTGRGEHLRVELLSSMLGGLINQASGYLTTGNAPRRMGNRHPSVAPYELLHCADGPIAVACGNDGQFARLTDVLGCALLATDDRFTTNTARVTNRDEMVDALESRLRTEPAAVWEERLVAVGVPAGLVGDVGDAIERAQRFGLEPLLELGPEHPNQVRHPVRYRNATVGVPTRPPELGEHDAQIRTWLATSDAAPLPRRAE